MHSFTLRTVPAVFVFVFCINLASAYTFQENPAVPDSVRLSLNTGKSTGGIVAIDVVAYQVTNVYSAAFDLDFNSSVLEWAGRFTHDPDGYERETFFGTSALYEIGPEIYVNGTRNKNKLVTGAIGNPSSPQNGSGSLMTIKFKVVGSGTTAVSFSNNNLIRPDMSFTSSSWYGGTFVSDWAIPAPPQDDSPVVSLNTPDQSVFSSRNVTLTCSASDDYGLVNLTLYTNITGSWQPYQTKIAGDNVWTESFSVKNLQQGTYKWNCRAADSKGQEASGQVEFSFRVQLPPDPN
ncbi:MAG: cohesin domain-containing protein, partial [Candidatus Aenigmarchaeota archaeon]|nr:cohesin domain-containing protein [Candidatus Aenigmarchaeota archaeon]